MAVKGTASLGAWRAQCAAAGLRNNSGDPQEHWQERGKLSWSYCSRIFHQCIKGLEKLITDRDIATSNPASGGCLTWSLLLLVAWFPCSVVGGEQGDGSSPDPARRAGTEQAIDVRGPRKENCASVVWPVKRKEQ